jgi:hypothetical protein
MSASEITIRISDKVGIAYIPKKLREQFGLQPIILPNYNAAVLYSSDANPEDVIRSLEVLIKHLELRKERKAVPTP